jgi:hypothetical protein
MYDLWRQWLVAIRQAPRPLRGEEKPSWPVPIALLLLLLLGRNQLRHQPMLVPVVCLRLALQVLALTEQAFLEGLQSPSKHLGN